MLQLYTLKMPIITEIMVILRGMFESPMQVIPNLDQPFLMYFLDSISCKELVVFYFTLASDTLIIKLKSFKKFLKMFFFFPSVLTIFVLLLTNET